MTLEAYSEVLRDLHMRRHFEEVFLAVRLNILLGVDRKLLIGIQRDQHLTDVGLQRERKHFHSTNDITTERIFLRK